MSTVTSGRRRGDRGIEMKLKLPEGPFKAYLFDCDGTIVDSMPLHYVAWKTGLAEWGVKFDEELFYSWGGMPVAEIIAALNVREGLAMPVDEVQRRKEGMYYNILPELKAVPEVLEHIHMSHGKIPFAVGSGSPRDSVTKSLETLGILDRFETLVCAGDYTKSKPDPEPFLIAAKRLGVAPGGCLVVGDTGMGIQAATAAGMGPVEGRRPGGRGGGGGR